MTCQIHGLCGNTVELTVKAPNVLVFDRRLHLQGKLPFDEPFAEAAVAIHMQLAKFEGILADLNETADVVLQPFMR